MWGTLVPSLGLEDPMEKIELMAIAAIWLDLQIVMLNEMSQTEKKI